MSGGDKGMKLRIFLEAVGAALLLLFPYYLPFFHPNNHALFHHDLPVTNLIGGVLVDLLGLALLTAAILFAIHCLSPVIRRVAEAIFASLILWTAILLVLQILIDMWFPLSFWQHRWQQSLFVILVSAGLLAYFFPRAMQPAVRVLRLALAAYAFSIIWVVPHLFSLAMAHCPTQSYASLHPASTSEQPRQRIIWILFDELSYEQTFAHRAVGLDLPNLTKLQAASFSFSNLKPAGYYTDRIIPSILTGQRFDEYRSTLDGRLLYMDESQHRWVAYDPSATLFGLAQRNGWNVGIDGWYNPYCRVLASFLNSCYWIPGSILPMEQYGASQNRSVLVNAAAAPRQLWAVLTGRAKTPVDQHLDAYRSLMSHAQELIGNNQIQFLFIHFPVPHPPGIYDRKHHALRRGGSYLDNLSLADDSLGALLQEIDTSPAAAQTTVIISSDHSWRVPIYRSQEDWSTEEEQATGGRFDDRPVLLIHFPGQVAAREVSDPYSELIEHEMIARMLSGQINNAGQLTTFLTSHARY
jgi:hypothetical protein